MSTFNTEADVFNEVVDVVSKQLSIEKDRVTTDANFVHDLGADSLDTVELVMTIEDHFNIEIPDDQADKITTPGAAAKYIFEELVSK
jgi:acyl carrier protein